MIAFRTGWPRHFGASPRYAEAMTSTGDSIEEAIRDGDTLLLDRSIRRVVDEGIYVVPFYASALVKRLQHCMRVVIARTGNNPLFIE
ncbi:hypothetical protein GCM10007874_41750 [Labrys miyagiensis]|uniref:Peptidase S24/S26A/S26B/S26C domain-containing protein n=2 Tax=Labrys miyagiensis TaxID=346912 RepID=A0ABQ6CN03_9HYPH|nr:hypothetical protein GCM10007874_41750 [Labrys miyagiensis]